MTIVYSDPISIPKGTFGIQLDFTVYNNDGTAHDLTDITGIKFQVWRKNKPGTLIVDGDCVVDVAASGTCHYTVVDGDFDTPYRYQWALELTKASYEDHTESAILEVTEAG
jgi:hypothetical protein